ncbi:16S rRNA (cytosine(967)-C(5))-methyltransferase RsmB [Paraliobacillus sp. X-1268]|uniref:16S rRNA (cytosine(967)-C(5))-methyltransferase RsmB n=1 Tax=Paraliobacillus sp. X-1268 TaxID=2213193 RepID=UPI000E3BED46|nr:16S rRNA (cytosine(967)-C(5))-methyltransferase RsmB [Paraliobacillus sp. X-1268]
MKKKNVRASSLDILLRIGDNGAFSHLLIDHTIKSNELSTLDQSLLTEIVYGTLQRKLTLDYFVTHFVKKPEKLASWVKWLLYLSFYQMHYLEKVPDHAIINEAVTIAKKRGHEGISSLVNGVLRSAQRSGFPSFDKISDDVERLSLETSHPLWLVKRWVKTYGITKTELICHANLHTKPMTVRVQPLKITRDDAMKVLEDEGYEVEASLFSEQGIVVVKGNVLKSDLFSRNSLSIQDQSSMLVAEMLQLEENQIVLDACSAPGGKTTHIAEKLKNTGQIFAYDLLEKKADLVAKKAGILGLTNIETKGADARNLDVYHNPNTFDRILVDAPCSGLGVIRGKPDIKYNKSEADINKLATIQMSLLENVAQLLKNDGKLLYSTCTVDKEENEKVVEAFLLVNTDFEIDKSFFETLPTFIQNAPGLSDLGLQIFPDDYQTDGFFLTRLQKK